MEVEYDKNIDLRNIILIQSLQREIASVAIGLLIAVNVFTPLFGDYENQCVFYYGVLENI